MASDSNPWVTPQVRELLNQPPPRAREAAPARPASSQPEPALAESGSESESAASSGDDHTKLFEQALLKEVRKISGELRKISEYLANRPD